MASIPQGTQQGALQVFPQLTLWQSEAQAPPGAESGFALPTIQLPGLAGSGMGIVAPVPPPCPLDIPPPPDAPPSEPVVPPVPSLGVEDEHPRTINPCAISATAKIFNDCCLFILSSLVVA